MQEVKEVKAVNIEELKKSVEVQNAYLDFLNAVKADSQDLTDDQKAVMFRVFTSGYGRALNNMVTLSSMTEITNKEYTLIVKHMSDSVTQALTNFEKNDV